MHHTRFVRAAVAAAVAAVSGLSLPAEAFPPGGVVATATNGYFFGTSPAGTPVSLLFSRDVAAGAFSVPFGVASSRVWGSAGSAQFDFDTTSALVIYNPLDDTYRITATDPGCAIDVVAGPAYDRHVAGNAGQASAGWTGFDDATADPTRPEVVTHPPYGQPDGAFSNNGTAARRDLHGTVCGVAVASITGHVTDAYAGGYATL